MLQFGSGARLQWKCRLGYSSTVPRVGQGRHERIVLGRSSRPYPLRGLHGRFARGLHTGGKIYGFRAVSVVDPSGRVDATGHPLVLGVQLVIASV